MNETTNRLYLPRSDIEEDQWQRQEEQGRQQNVAQQLFTGLGLLLDHAEAGLNELENNDMLGSAIVRRCQELADAIGNLTNQIDQQSDQERRDLARACLNDAQHQLQLQQEEVGVVDDDIVVDRPNQPTEEDSATAATQVAQMSEDEMVNVISVACSLLRDVESALRGIDPNDADEIADAALIAARLFLVSLQSFHDRLGASVAVAPSTASSSSREFHGQDDQRIEYLDDDNANEEHGSETPLPKTSPSGKQWRQQKRIRALWPPIGPAVGNVLNWGKDEAMKRPLLAVAMGITLWPAAVCSVFIGTPIVLADGLIQQVYGNFQDKALIQGLECGVAQLYQTGRLTLLCGKLVGKQTIRVISHQIEERGGVGQILEQVGHFAVDRATHPVETISATWNGVVWGAGAIRDFVAKVVNHNDDDERSPIAQALQQ